MEASVAQTAAERDARRGDIALTFGRQRQELETKYVEESGALKDKFLKEKNELEAAQRKAYTEVGLNPDGSDPQGRPQGSVE